MTYVEFFDESGVENISSMLVRQPEKTIFVGTQKNAMIRFVELCKLIFREKKTEYEIIAFPANTPLDTMTDAFLKIMTENEECVFDLTGGSETALVAVGIAAERCHGQGIRMHKVNVRTGAVTVMGIDGISKVYEDIRLSVRDTVLLNGGLIAETPMLHSGKVAEEHADEIDALWKMSQEMDSLWNRQTANLAYLEAYAEHSSESTLENGFALSWEEVEKTDDWNAHKGRQVVPFLQQLKEAGFLSTLELTDTTLSLQYGNAFLHNCLTHSGSILEWKVLLEAARFETEDGKRLYHDCLGNVSILWNREGESSETNLLNEIDAIVMKGAVPIFISCKNGSFDTNELYKFSTVADSFGGRYVRKALFSARDDISAALMVRAEELGIRLITGLSDITDAAFKKKMKTLWL